jgi:hypothetical protein
MLETLRRKQPSQVAFKLPSQGKVLNFVRQGPPGKLSVTAMGKEVFSIVVWVLIIAAGVLMLKLSGFDRILVILAAGLVAGMIHLYSPLLISQVARTGVFAGILVILLWVAQWGFVKLPKIRQALPPKRKPQPAAAKKPASPAKQQEQPKQNEE